MVVTMSEFLKRQDRLFKIGKILLYNYILKMLPLKAFVDRKRKKNLRSAMIVKVYAQTGRYGRRRWLVPFSSTQILQHIPASNLHNCFPKAFPTRLPEQAVLDYGWNSLNLTQLSVHGLSLSLDISPQNLTILKGNGLQMIDNRCYPNWALVTNLLHWAKL